MKLVLVLVILLAVNATTNLKKKVFKTNTIPLDQPLPTQMPNFISVDNQEYKNTHHKIEYTEDSFTSVRAQQLKSEQTTQDSSLMRAIEHSTVTNLIQIKQDSDVQNLYLHEISSEIMTEQEVQQALMTVEDLNNIPDIEMAADSTYQGEESNNDYIDYFIPQVTDGDGALEETNDVDQTIQPEIADIEMPNEDVQFLQVNYKFR